MSHLEYPDRHHLNAAVGWLELGAIEEAEREIARISASNREHSDVLDLRWQIHAEAKNWAAALKTARLHVNTTPASPTPWIHQSYALHELKRTEEALAELLPLADRFPDIGTIPYNLACYTCRLGRLEETRDWLRRAFKLRGKKATLAMALTDPDLEGIRAELKSL